MRNRQQRAQNTAQQYSNRIIPEARGEAQQAIEQANAYKQEVIAQAQGDASRFNQLLTEYRKAPDVTRQRLYIDSIENVMTKHIESGDEKCILSSYQTSCPFLQSINQSISPFLLFSP